MSFCGREYHLKGADIWPIPEKAVDKNIVKIVNKAIMAVIVEFNTKAGKLEELAAMSQMFIHNTCQVLHRHLSVSDINSVICQTTDL